MPKIDVLFINTGLEFPETVEYVQKLCSNNKLRLRMGMEGIATFFKQAESFGPPAKDYIAGAAKPAKAGPMTSFLAGQYPRGA